LKKKSIWSLELNYNKFPTLEKDIEVDVLIIGAGITGLSVAYHLMFSNLKVCVVEKKSVGSGITSKTTGKLTYLQNLIYSKITDNYSFSVANLYYESQKEAIETVQKIINDNNIECDYKKQKSYLFGTYKEDIKKIKKEKELLEKMGVIVKDVKKLPINIHNYYGIGISDTAYFHPIKYLNSLADICSKKMPIYENTKIIDFKKENECFICFTNTNKIKTKKIVFACHYPFFTIPYLFPIRGYLERSYISASPVSDNKDVSGINSSTSSISFRYHNNYLIYLNGSHILANNFNYKENFKYLYKDLEKLTLIPEFIWSNEDIITSDYLPYIGEFKENLYIGVGYNTWGMTNGTIAGKVISDLILNNKNKYVNLFNPRRSISFFNIFYNMYSSLKPFIVNKLFKNKKFYNDKIIFTIRNGKNVGIYIDDNKKEHIVYNKCPHLGCSLVFNEEEKTWDCPCHSSRFDIDGKVVKGPSNYDISYKKNDKN